MDGITLQQHRDLGAHPPQRGDDADRPAALPEPDVGGGEDVHVEEQDGDFGQRDGGGVEVFEDEEEAEPLLRCIWVGEGLVAPEAVVCGFWGVS